MEGKTQTGGTGSRLSFLFGELEICDLTVTDLKGRRVGVVVPSPADPTFFSWTRTKH